MKDPHKVLGVSRTADKESIKTAYRALMKVHHPDKGGETQAAVEIDTAYRQLISSSSALAVGTKSTEVTISLSNVVLRGKYLEINLLDLTENTCLSCPRDCGFFGRICRYKQQLSVESADLYSLRATALKFRVKSLVDYPQTVDCRTGKAVLIDQHGDFYHCQPGCSPLHPPKFKEAAVEMFGGTQASICLWYPQLGPGRFINRFVFKHRVLARDAKGQFWDEEIMEAGFSPHTFRK